MKDFFSGTLKKIKALLDIKERKFLFYHRDADGVASAALVMKFFSDFIPVPRRGPAMESGFVESVIKNKPDLVFFVDMPVDQEWKKISLLKKGLPDMKILVIDHHIPEKNLSSRNVVHFNPRFRQDVYLPASFLVYKILERLGEGVGKYVWIACIGVIGDYGFDECKELLKECRKAYPELLASDPFRSKLGLGVELVSAAITLKGLAGAERALEVMLRSETCEEFLRSSELRRWKVVVDKELDKILKRFEQEEKKVKKGGESKQVDVFSGLNLIFYVMKTKLSMTSPVSSMIAIKNPRKTIVIAKKSGDEWKLSLRNQTGKINLNRIVKRCVKGIGSGGGHVKAAGALVNDFEEFRKRFVTELGKSSKA
jgi:single-stranded DNA-specific DHH superfamily exonuclease